MSLLPGDRLSIQAQICFVYLFSLSVSSLFHSPQICFVLTSDTIALKLVYYRPRYPVLPLPPPHSKSPGKFSDWPNMDKCIHPDLINSVCMFVCVQRVNGLQVNQTVYGGGIQTSVFFLQVLQLGMNVLYSVVFMKIKAVERIIMPMN